jgi:phage protein U
MQPGKRSENLQQTFQSLARKRKWRSCLGEERGKMEMKRKVGIQEEEVQIEQ